MSETQPMLPVREIPRSIEYMPGGPDQPEWAIGDWRGIHTAFDLREDEVVDWHRALAEQGRPWLVVRRIHSIAPLWGEGAGPDDMKTWTWPLLAQSIGVPEAVLRKELEAAVEFWKKARMSLSIQRASDALSAGSNGESPAPVAAAGDPAAMPDLQVHHSFDPERITAILTPLRFNHIKNEGDRLYVANRILELNSLLKDKYKREVARQLVVMELGMANYESIIAGLKDRLDFIRRGDIRSGESKEIREIGETLEKQEKALTKLTKDYQSLANELGGDEIEAGEARRLAVGTVSHLVEAHREYYASGKRHLIDGMFTADEIVWLTESLTIRAPQYRIDIVMRVREACEPQNLWGGEYVPGSFAKDGKTHRDACRRLAKIVAGISDEVEPQVIVGIDDAVPDLSVDEDDPADVSASVIPAPDPAASTYHPAPAAAAAEEDERCMAVS